MGHMGHIRGYMIFADTEGHKGGHSAGMGGNISGMFILYLWIKGSEFGRCIIGNHWLLLIMIRNQSLKG